MPDPVREQLEFFPVQEHQGIAVEKQNGHFRRAGKTRFRGGQKKAEEYAAEKEDIQQEAKKQKAESEHELKTHQSFAKSVTFFQIAIAMGAIAVLTKRKSFWFFSLAVGVVGAVFFVQAFLLAGAE